MFSLFSRRCISCFGQCSLFPLFSLIQPIYLPLLDMHACYRQLELPLLCFEVLLGLSILLILRLLHFKVPSTLDLTWTEEDSTTAFTCAEFLKDLLATLAPLLLMI